MNYTGPVYRPPWEADSLLLQVTVGCAHNRCTFCTMYRDTPFSIDPIEQIEKDIQEARRTYKTIKRIFLVNGDAFVLSGRRLKEIAEKIIEYIPEVEVITMYASINNIKSKTDEELLQLRNLRINDLWIGIETAHSETLNYLNKGFSLEETKVHLERLNQAGMDFYYGFMYGAAGKGRGIENAVENAKLINVLGPKGVAPTTLGVNEGSVLAEDVKSGKFEMATEREVIEEMKKTIELINTDDLIYYGAHAINSIPFNCILPRDREKALETIDMKLSGMKDGYLDNVPQRHSI